MANVIVRLILHDEALSGGIEKYSCDCNSQSWHILWVAAGEEVYKIHTCVGIHLNETAQTETLFFDHGTIVGCASVKEQNYSTSLSEDL